MQSVCLPGGSTQNGRDAFRQSAVPALSAPLLFPPVFQTAQLLLNVQRIEFSLPEISRGFPPRNPTQISNPGTDLTKLQIVPLLPIHKISRE